MRAVRCSGHQLPFRDLSFDGVVVSDVMEHVPPELREAVLKEALRVARKIAVFAYPCGPAALALDRRLHREFQMRGMQPPCWLQEHMLHPFPDEKLFCGLPPAWKQKVLPNERLRFHYWMMSVEMSRWGNRLFGLALQRIPRVVELLLRRADGEPSYRKIFVLTRELQSSYV